MLLTLVRARTSVRLGQELGRGGEAAVFLLEDRRNQVAKLYSTPPDQKKVQKLIYMAEVASPALLQIAAWPVDLVTDDKSVVLGFVMPRIVAHRGIHELYSPKSRSEAFPEADFKFLVHVCTNIARAFAVVHEHGYVIGDINHGNLLVGLDGTVKLIDCDSFQIALGTQVFFCDVGVPLFTAPEIQNRPFRGLLRNSNHDRFALAVLLFHLLYMGRHPFAGRYFGPGDMQIDRAIAEYRFAYGKDHASSGMERPPGTIPLRALGADVAMNFERAFSRSGASDSRPGARSWINTLDCLKAGLRVCSTASWHQYPASVDPCPWCIVETQTGVRLFGIRIAMNPQAGSIDIVALWKAIMEIPDPGPDPSLPSELAWKPPTGVVLPNRLQKDIRKILSIALACSGFIACKITVESDGIIWAIVAYALAYALWPRVPEEKRTAAEADFVAAKAAWENISLHWQREATRMIFVERQKDLEKARIELADLPNERRRRLEKLESQRESKQRQRYLERFRIDQATISGIGNIRTAMLASFGIETAADVDAIKIMQIPGFGGALTNALVEWRRNHERNFRFEPQEPLNQRDIQAMGRELESRQLTLLTKLQKGPTTLRLLSQEIIAARSRLMPILENVWNSYKLAEAKRDAL